MKTVLSLYFDGTMVQALTACPDSSGGSVKVNDARTFPFYELDDYLASRSEKSCVLCCNPFRFYQDILNLPPVADKLYDKLVRLEMQKAHPDLTSFSIDYRIVGESTIDSRQFRKIAVFSYPDEFLNDFIGKVAHHGIMISNIFAAPGAIFRLALSTCAEEPGQPRIFIATLPGEKLFLVSENNELEFIRLIPSNDSALLPEDTENINMTVDYCFQTLRMRPFEAVMLNQSDELSGELSDLVSVPYRSAMPPQLEDLPHDIIRDYLAPAAAALHSLESPGTGNIVPADYAAFTTDRKLLTAAFMLLILLTLLLAAHIVTERLIISGLKSKISMVRTELNGSEAELATFRKLDAEADQFKKQIEFVNRYNSAQNPATALAALILPETGDYAIKGISVKSGDGFLTVQMDGSIIASGYSATQASFEKFVSFLAKIPGYTVSSSSLDINGKTFGIQARYNGGGQQKK